MTRLLVPVLCALSLGACTKQGFLEAPKADDAVIEKVGSFSTDTHFLLEPTADAESLLGRSVHVTSSGGWTIADELAPGCQVRAKRMTADFEKSYRINLGDMTAMSGGYAELVKLEARYGRSIEAAMKVHNLETLTADIEGPCGEVIVKSVRVGTGERTLQRKAEGGAEAKVGKGPIAVGVGRNAATDALDEMRWSSPHAYAFTYEQPKPRKRFEVNAELNGPLVEEEEIRLEISADSEAYLIIFYLDQTGEGDLLFPNPTVPVPKVEAGQILVLPPEGTGGFKAALLEPGKPARDTVVVYAFSTLADFENYRPGAFADGATGMDYIGKLTDALSLVPISRWDRHSAILEIKPKPAKPTEAKKR